MTKEPEETKADLSTPSPITVIEDTAEQGDSGEDKEVAVVENSEKEEVTEEVSSSMAIPAGPPQPSSPPIAEDLPDESDQSIRAEKEQLEKEVVQMKQELKAARAEIEEARRMNTYACDQSCIPCICSCGSQLTDQFIRRVDDLEHDHQVECLFGCYCLLTYRSAKIRCWPRSRR